jgi:hypothetical protein
VSDGAGAGSVEAWDVNVRRSETCSQPRASRGRGTACSTSSARKPRATSARPFLQHVQGSRSQPRVCLPWRYLGTPESINPPAM